MNKRLFRTMVIGMLLVGLAGMRPLPSFAATVSGCPTTETDLRNDISQAGNGGTVAFTCATTILFDSPIEFTQSVTLDASGARGTVTFDGGSNTQLLIVNQQVTLTLKGLTLAHGRSSSYGGAVFNWGTLTVSSSTFSSDSAPLYGGAIANIGTVTVTTSTFLGDTGSQTGGAIYSQGTLTVSSSTFSSNSSSFGGAIFIFGTAHVSSSTFSSNAATYGGAIFNGGATMTIINSTISGNSASLGGAILNNHGTMTIGGSIIANSARGGNCYNAATIIDAGYNLSDTNCGFSTAKHDLINTNPQLGPLQNNGGPTQTMALLRNSPAIDQIPMTDSALCPTSGTDQRGYARPDDGESACDIGAYESAYIATTTTLASSANPSASGQPVSFTATVTPSSGTGTPTGTIQFAIDGKPFGSPVSLSGGKATSQSTSSLAPGKHTVTAAYSEDATYLSSSGSLTQTVAQSHLAGALSSSFHPVEGQSSSGAVATFTDTNTSIAASQLTATISWGDGTSSSGTVSGSNGHFVVSGSHSYADEGGQRVSVTLQEQTPGRASGTASGTGAVAEGDTLTPLTTTAPPATASRSFSGPVAAFSDTDTANSPRDFTATINWGDGTTSAGTVSGSGGKLVVSGSHTYSLPGRYTVQTTIRDDAPGTASATATTSLLVMVPASSSGITVETDGTTDCTSVASSTKVSSSGSPSGTFAFRDERPGGSPCGAYRVGVVTLQAMGIDAVVCTSHTTASIYGRAKQGINPSTTASMVSFRADVAMTSQSVPFNGTVRVQTSAGYSSGAVPASVHLTGC